VRGLFTSDNFYTWNKLPQDFQFKAPAGSDRKEFEKQFLWTCIPSVSPELVDQYLKESSPLKPQVSEDSQEDDNNSMFRNSELEDRKLPIDEYEESKQSEKKQYADHTMTKSELGNIGSGSNKTDEKEDKQVFEEGSKIAPAGNANKSEKLSIDPIMKMDYVIGYTGKNLKWSPNKEDKSIVYASGGLLVCLNVRSNTQRFFLGHTDMITCFTFSQDGTFIASGQDGKRATVRIWDYMTGKTYSVLHPDLKTVE
jgi:WD40 repeat protein